MDSNKIIKICDILFYADTLNAVQESVDLELTLKQPGIGCYHRIDLVFNDSTLLTNLRTSTFGLDYNMYENLNLPIVTWKEYYDDYERCINIARTPEELLNSNLFANLHLVLPTLSF